MERARTSSGDVCILMTVMQSCTQYYRKEPLICHLVSSPLNMDIKIAYQEEVCTEGRSEE